MESETTSVFPVLNPRNPINPHPINLAIAKPRMRLRTSKPMLMLMLMLVQTSINHLRRKRSSNRRSSRESHRLVIIPGNMTVITITLQNRMMILIQIVMRMRTIHQLEVEPLEVRERGRMMIRIRGMKVPRIIRMMKMKVKMVTRLEDTIVSKLGKFTIKGGLLACLLPF